GTGLESQGVGHETMNPPSTPPKEGSRVGGAKVSSPTGRGQGWVLEPKGSCHGVVGLVLFPHENPLPIQNDLRPRDAPRHRITPTRGSGNDGASHEGFPRLFRHLYRREEQ